MDCLQIQICCQILVCLKCLGYCNWFVEITAASREPIILKYAAGLIQLILQDPELLTM